jgi:toxin ParE1/3/4
LLRRARTDLIDIARYTADRWDEQQAERYVSDLFGAFQRLVDLPELRRPYGPIAPYGRALEGSHAIFYRLTDDAEILIVRVLHVRMLPELHLDESDESKS